MKNIYASQQSQIKDLQIELGLILSHNKVLATHLEKSRIELLEFKSGVKQIEENLELELEMALEIEELEDELDEMDAREELRDWFAGLAMQSLITVREDSLANSTFAKLAYNFADSMLEQREM